MSFNPSYFKKPPQEYIENFVEYTPGFDNVPQEIHYIMHGFTMREAERMHDLIRIEAMKYLLAETKRDGDATPEELEYFETYIAERIEKYNNKGHEVHR